MDQEHKGEDIDVIGQFGVGFYSAFMVADAVTVISKAYGSDEAFMWQSDGADGYTITPCEKDAPGSDIIMHIKPNADEENYDQYLETYKLQELIKKYSDYIRYPIVMEVEDYREAQARGRGGGLQARVGDGEGVEDHQLHGPPVAAPQGQGH